MANSVDPDQLASEEANWFGSTLFAKTGHVVISKRRVKSTIFTLLTGLNSDPDQVLQNLVFEQLILFSTHLTVLDTSTESKFKFQNKYSKVSFQSLCWPWK